MSDTRLLLDGTELEPLLAQARELGGRVVKAERVRRGGLFGGARYEVTVAAPGLDAADPDAPDARVTGLAALLQAAEAADGVEPRDGVAPAGTRSSRPTGGRPAAGTEPAPARGHPARPSSGPETGPPVGTPRRTATGALRDVGVPTRLLPGAPSPPRPDGSPVIGTALTAALLAVARALPAPPRLLTRPGAVVAVVGRPGPVLETCSQVLLQHTGCRLVLVGEELPGPGARLTSPRRAARLRQEAAEEVVLVAVAAGGTRAQQRTARRVLEALAPDQTWVAVDARRPPGDLAHELRSAPGGDRLTAVAAQHTDQAAEPGVLLDLEVPVGRLDGLPATPVVWARVLEEALLRANDRSPHRSRSAVSG